MKAVIRKEMKTIGFMRDFGKIPKELKGKDKLTYLS